MDFTKITRSELLYLAILVEGGLGVIAVVVGYIIGEPIEKYISWDLSSPVRGIIIALPMLVGFFLSAWYPVGSIKKIKHFIEETIKPLFSRLSIFEIALISLLAGIGEEFMFRGLIQPVIANWFGFWIGLTVAAVLFGAFHLITPTYAILATLVGFYLGILFHYTGNLLDVVIAHGLYDFVALVYLVNTPNKDIKPEIVPEENTGSRDPE